MSTPRPPVSPPPVWPVVLAGFAAFINLYATQALLPLLMRIFQATPGGVSLTVTAATVAVAIAAPVVGGLADRIGRPQVIVGSAMLLTGVTALAATSRTLGQLVGWRFAQGLLTPGIFAVSLAYIHEHWPTSHAGRATAAYVSGTVVGGFCGRAVAGLVAAAAGWRMSFVALAVIMAATSVGLWAALIGSTRFRQVRHSAASSSPIEPATPAAGRAVGQHGDGSTRGSLWALLRNRRLMATNTVGFCVLFTLVATFTYVTFHLAAPPYNLSTAALAWLFSVYLVGAAVTPIAGRWTDTRGHRAALGRAVSIGLTGALFLLTPWLVTIMLGLALVATGVFVAQATASGYIGNVTDRDRGLAVGLYSTFYYLGGSAGAAVPAVFWNAGGWKATVGLVMAVQAGTFLMARLFWHGPSGSRSAAARVSTIEQA
jgi:MFS transporter, YNFM family, putative membrane transport protein